MSPLTARISLPRILALLAVMLAVVNGPTRAEEGGDKPLRQDTALENNASTAAADGRRGPL